MPRFISYPSCNEHDLSSPDVAKLELLDVAHHLSRISRYNGGCVRHYSVAEHSIRVAVMVGQMLGGGVELSYAALLHDAHEAYVGDQTAPLLEAVPALRELCLIWAGCCASAFDVSPSESTSSVIHRADLAIRDDERAALLPFGWSLEPSFYWSNCESDLMSLGLLSDPSFRFATATIDRVESLFVRCCRRFLGAR